MPTPWRSPSPDSIKCEDALSSANVSLNLPALPRQHRLLPRHLRPFGCSPTLGSSHLPERAPIAPQTLSAPPRPASRRLLGSSLFVSPSVFKSQCFLSPSRRRPGAACGEARWGLPRSAARVPCERSWGFGGAGPPFSTRQSLAPLRSSVEGMSLTALKFGSGGLLPKTRS